MPWTLQTDSVFYPENSGYPKVFCKIWGLWVRVLGF